MGCGLYLRDVEEGRGEGASPPAIHREMSDLFAHPAQREDRAMILKSLDSFNADRWAAHKQTLDANKPHPNGIACPQCGAELWDSNPMVTLTSCPAQKNVHCPACGHVGYRLA